MGALTHNGEVLQRLPANASQINFDKSGTNLNSTQTENAIKEVNTKANTLQSEKADTDIVAADFNAGTSYTAGNYCIYEGKFYKFKANHSGAWSAADVDEIKIAGELASLKSGLIDVGSMLDAYPVSGGDRVILAKGDYKMEMELFNDGANAGKIHVVLKINNNTVFNQFFAPV